jgi:hypothetical protein
VSNINAWRRRHQLLLAISVESGKIARSRFIDAAEVTDG